MTDIGTHYVGDDCPGGHRDVEDGEPAPQREPDGRPAADGRRLLARFFLPLDMGAVAKSMLLFASAYPNAVLDNPDGDGTVVDLFDGPAAPPPHAS